MLGLTIFITKLVFLVGAVVYRRKEGDVLFILGCTLALIGIKVLSSFGGMNFDMYMWTSTICNFCLMFVVFFGVSRSTFTDLTLLSCLVTIIENTVSIQIRNYYTLPFNDASLLVGVFDIICWVLIKHNPKPPQPQEIEKWTILHHSNKTLKPC